VFARSEWREANPVDGVCALLRGPHAKRCQTLQPPMRASLSEKVPDQRLGNVELARGRRDAIPGTVILGDGGSVGGADGQHRQQQPTPRGNTSDISPLPSLCLLSLCLLVPRVSSWISSTLCAPKLTLSTPTGCVPREPKSVSRDRGSQGWGALAERGCCEICPGGSSPGQFSISLSPPPR